MLAANESLRKCKLKHAFRSVYAVSINPRVLLFIDFEILKDFKLADLSKVNLHDPKS